jgi:hydroxyacylglutathione hydrolase
MFFRQYDLACLSMYSYMIGDTTSGRAVVVDPQRDVTQYLADADRHGLMLERVIETHLHADFLSGHLELAHATGAAISYGGAADVDFEIDPLSDGQVLSLGDVLLEIRHTPGHTPESISIVLRQHPDAPVWAVLTGDTLFIGDVGRPDLLTSVGRTADDLARELHHSLQTKLLTLPDTTLIYPAHGAGSSCGKHLSTAASSTIGEQRASNYALAPMTDDEFVAAVTEGQSLPPPYFKFAADANRRNRALLDDQEAPVSLTVAEALALGEKVTLIDTRSPESFASEHLRGSINVGLDGRFAECAGNVIPPGQRVVIVGDPDRATEAKVRLARIGFDDIAGAIDATDGFLIEHPDLAASATHLLASNVRSWLAEDNTVQVIDVRDPGETRVGGTIPGARTMPLPQLLEHLDELDPARSTIVYCAGGYRSSIAASLMRAHGFRTVADITGGYGAWTALTSSTAPANKDSHA